MKRNKISEQIDPFKNKEEKGLFTFYLQSQLPKKPSKLQTQQTKNLPSIEESKLHNFTDSKRTTPRKSVNESVHQQRRKMKTLGNDHNEEHSNVLTGKKSRRKKIVTEGRVDQINKIKQLFNFKRRSNMRLLQQCIVNTKKISSSKSIKQQRSNINQQNLYRKESPIARINPQLVYPLDEVKQRSFFPSLSPKNFQTLEKDYHSYQNSLISQFSSPKQKINVEKTIHQLKCQAIAHPEKFKSILFPSTKKWRNPYVKEKRSISDEQMMQERISIELKSKYESPSALEKLIKCRCSSQKMHQSIKNDSEYKESLDNLSPLQSTKKHRLFNTLERSLMSSLQKVDQEQYQNDLSHLLKRRSSNLLKKRSQQNTNDCRNISQFRAKQSVIAVLKSEPTEQVRKNESELVYQKKSYVQYGNPLGIFKKRSNQSEKYVNEMKRNFLQILTKIKDRYQSI